MQENQSKRHKYCCFVEDSLKLEIVNGAQALPQICLKQKCDGTVDGSLKFSVCTSNYGRLILCKGGRFVSRYLANSIYCIILKYRDIAIIGTYTGCFF